MGIDKNKKENFNLSIQVWDNPTEKEIKKQNWHYHDVTSSNANNTPPTGALKAAATPAAHPQVTFSNKNVSMSMI